MARGDGRARRGALSLRARRPIMSEMRWKLVAVTCLKISTLDIVLKPENKSSGDPECAEINFKLFYKCANPTTYAERLTYLSRPVTTVRVLPSSNAGVRKSPTYRRIHVADMILIIYTVIFY